MDLPAMDRCKVGKKGRHELAAIIPGEDELEATLYCQQCGALRRFPATGDLLPSRLDDLTPAEWKSLER